MPLPAGTAFLSQPPTCDCNCGCHCTAVKQAVAFAISSDVAAYIAAVRGGGSPDPATVDPDLPGCVAAAMLAVNGILDPVGSPPIAWSDAYSFGQFPGSQRYLCTGQRITYIPDDTTLSPAWSNGTTDGVGPFYVDGLSVGGFPSSHERPIAGVTIASNMLTFSGVGDVPAAAATRLLLADQGNAVCNSFCRSRRGIRFADFTFDPATGDPNHILTVDGSHCGTAAALLADPLDLPADGSILTYPTDPFAWATTFYYYSQFDLVWVEEGCEDCVCAGIA